MKEDKFLPTQLIQITNFLSDFIKSKPLVQNIGYTFQYCQYLKHLIKETEVTAVILKQLYKSYIISGVAILEAIFYAILEQEGKIKTFQWKEENNPSIISIDERTKLKINILRKIETSSPKGLKFIAILNQIKKLDFFGQSEQFFKDISDKIKYIFLKIQKQF